MADATYRNPLAWGTRALVHAVDRHRLLMAAQQGIGLYELLALGHLYADGPLTPTDLSGRLHVTSASVTGLVDRLEAGGLVSRSPYPNDRRRVLVAITDAGTAAIDPAFTLFEQAIGDASRDCDEAERSRLLRFVTDAADNLDRRDAELR
jgi:DNA-binding MarR family transcriptional regulator